MTWFIAKIIISFTTPGSERVLVHENAVLVEGASTKEAWDHATAIGKESEYEDPMETLDDQPVTRRFEGIRSLISISNEPPLDQDQDAPAHGSEVSYSVFEVAKSDLNDLSEGNPVVVTYLE